MTDVYTNLDDAGWLDLFESIEHSWFRLETLQVYSVDYEDKGQAQFRSTGLVDTTPNEWREMIRRHVESGRHLDRVHVVEEPLTDYMRYEMALYVLNHKAGEQIGIIPTSPGAWPAGLPEATDFWLFDDVEVWDMRYDEAGGFLDATRSCSSEHLDECRRWKELAQRDALPVRDYALTPR